VAGREDPAYWAQEESYSKNNDYIIKIMVDIPNPIIIVIFSYFLKDLWL